jgi:hypothetical protein
MIKANSGRLKSVGSLGYRIGGATIYRIYHLGPRISDLGSPGLGSPVVLTPGWHLVS